MALTRRGSVSPTLLRAEPPPSRLGHEGGRASALQLKAPGVLQYKPWPSQEQSLLAPAETTISVPACLLIGERDRRLYVLGPEKIDYIEADGNYVKFHVGSIDYIARNSVKRLAVMMAQSGFFRIERSLLVNVRAISYVQRAGRGTYSFTLLSGACLHSGAKFRDHILRVLPLA